MSVSGRTLTIRPGVLLPHSAAYAVQMSAGVLTDASGNPFAGINNDTTWNFSTAAPDTKEFSVGEINFATAASASDLLHGVTPVTTGWNTGNGATPGELSDGIHGQTFAAVGNTVEGAWTRVGATAEYVLGAGPNGTGYDVLSIQSIAAWIDVAFGNQAWSVEVKPVGGSYAPLATVNYQPLTGKGSTRVVLSGPGPLLASGIERIRFTANQVNNGGNGGAFVWRELDVFGQATPPAVDNGTPPSITTLNPSDEASGVVSDSALVATFDENVVAGTGSIRIRNLDTSAETVIPVSDPRITVLGNILTIRPNPKLAPFTRYAVRIDAGAIQDSFAHPFAGISNDSTWNFITGKIRLRIMPIGDSITAGYTDNPNWNVPYWYGYRSGLYNRLHTANYEFIFVGQSTELPNHSTGTPPADLAILGQNKHNGYGGVTVSYLNANILNWLATDNPDVILLKIGTNGQDQSGLNTLVQTIVTAKPDLHLIIAEIMPMYNYNQNVVNYNSWIRQTLVPGYQAQGKHVTRVDQYAPFLTNPADLTSIDHSLFSNGINHPSNPGYDKMAATWFPGIEALGLNVPSYGEWIANPAFGIAPQNRGFTNDPDGDGLTNGVEAWLGTNPGSSSVGLANLAGGGTSFSFTHSRNTTPIAGLSASYEWSPDLVIWYAANGVAGPASGLKVNCVANVAGASVSAVATANQPMANLFMRLVVSPP